MTTPTEARDRLASVLAELARADAPEDLELDADELLDYLSDRLPADARARLERRLVADPEASSRMVDLADFQNAVDTAGSAPPQVATRAAWRDFQARQQEYAPVTLRASRFPPVWGSLAAALLVATVGLGGWVARLQSERDQPVANLTSLELVTAVRSPGDEAVELAPGQPLYLVIEPTERCAAYDAELTGPGPGDRTPISGLVTNDREMLTVYLPRLAPGAYRLTVSPCDPAGRPTEHRFRIVQPPGPGGDGG